MSEKFTYQPDTAIHPGETVRDILEAVEMTQAELAGRTGLTPKTINEIVKGKSSITTDTATRFSAVFGTSASFWNNLERSYRETLARLEEEKAIELELRYFTKFEQYYKQLEDCDYVEKTRIAKERVRQLLTFFGVSSLRYVETIHSIAYRVSRHKGVSEESLAMWLRCGELEAEKISTGPYDKNRLVEDLKRIRKMSRKKKDEFWDELVEMCAMSGVAVVNVPYFKKTQVNGATRWIHSDKAIVQISTKGKRMDIFWFTFFHELAHVVKHGKKEQFIEFKKGREKEDIKEKEADDFAMNVLIPKKDYEKLIARKPLNDKIVDDFARKQGISAGIVAGRLAHDFGIWKEVAHLREAWLHPEGGAG